MTRLPDNAEVVFSGKSIRLQPGVIVAGGPQGPPGQPGDFDNVFDGPWDSGTSYLAGRIVTHGGSSWLSLAPSSNVTPVEGASWTMVAEGGTDGTNGQGVPTGGSTNQVLAKTSGTNFATAWVTPASTGGVLASHTYSAADKSTTSATIVDIDAANLAITFTAPASGKVIVDITAHFGHFGSSGGLTLFLREGSTTLATCVPIPAATLFDYIGGPQFKITGLTPGSSHTYKLSWHRGTAGTATMNCNTNCPTTLVVKDAVA